MNIRTPEFWLLMAFAGLLVIASPAHADDRLIDHKYCGQPARDSNGTIIRSSKVKAAFRAAVACPSTGLFIGTCPGWSIDHTWPLASCGCDSVTNMAWLKNTIKSCAGTECKDRWERRVYQCKPEDLLIQ